MPGGDRTGPMGMGPRSGRAAGYCGGFGVPGYENFAPGRGFRMNFFNRQSFWGRGFGGGGRGWRNIFYATGIPGWMRSGRYAAPYPNQVPYWKSDPEEETQLLEDQARVLQSELDFVKKRLSEIKAETTEKKV
jgi:hypothetical protein